MAKFYGKDSAYLAKEQLKFFLSSAALVCLPLVIIYIVWKAAPPVWTGASAIVLLILLMLVLEPLGNFWSAKANKFYRGGAGEKAVKKVLQELPEDFTVFEDVKIGERRGNIDFVVLGPGGVFVVEVKSHGGNIAYNGYSLTLNGRRFRDENILRQVHGEVWALKRYLEQELGEQIYVHAALVFSHAYASMEFGLQPVENVYVIRKHDLPALFNYVAPYRYPAARERVEAVLAKTVAG